MYFQEQKTKSHYNNKMHVPGDHPLSWGFENTGEVVNDGEYKEYGKKFDENDVVGAYLVILTFYSSTMRFKRGSVYKHK